MPVRFWQDMTREELSDVATTAIVVVPVGAIEQHGKHLPTKTDTFLVTVIVESACAALPADVTAVVTPTVWCGSSRHHLPFGGTLSLSQETLSAVLMDLARSCVASGFDRVLLVNGHGGNVEICGAIAKRAAIELDILAAAVSYWSLLPAGRDIPGHAGAFETSIMLALAPSSVRLETASASTGRLPDAPFGGVVVEDPRNWKEIDGWTDDPSLADATSGQDYAQGAASALTRTIEALARKDRR